jgi:hypothetical protein
MATKKPVFFNVQTSQGGELSFESIADLQGWVSAETQAWQWLIDGNGVADAGSAMGQLRNEYANWLSDLRQRVNQLAANPPSQNELKNQLHANISSFLGQNDKVLSNHEFARIASDIAKRFSAASGVGALALLLGKQCQMTLGTARGMTYAILARDGIDPKSPNIVAKAISDLRSEQDKARATQATEWDALGDQAKSLLSKTETEFRTQTDGLDQRSSETLKRIVSFTDDAIKSIKATESVYREQMKLQAPVAYWSDKAERHREAVWWSRWRLIGFVVLFAIGLVWLLVYLADHAAALAIAGPSSGSIALLKYSAIAVVVTTIVFMAGRMLLKIYLSDRHLLTDAEERVAMIQTYLALSSEGKVGETDRALILAPLFRSAADGIIKDEGMDSSIVGLLAKGIEKIK